MTAFTSRRIVASVAALALAVVPATATASSTHSGRKQAEKYCRTLLKKEGGANFKKQYGPKNAFGKCVASYEKSHPSTHTGKAKGHTKHSHGKAMTKGQSK